MCEPKKFFGPRLIAANVALKVFPLTPVRGEDITPKYSEYVVGCGAYCRVQCTTKKGRKTRGELITKHRPLHVLQGLAYYKKEHKTTHSATVSHPQQNAQTRKQ